MFEVPLPTGAASTSILVDSRLSPSVRLTGAHHRNKGARDASRTGESWIMGRGCGMVCTVLGLVTKRQRYLWFVLAVVVHLLGAAPAWPWGCEGHETIALIAARQLTPHARKMVDELLQPSPIDRRLERSCRTTGNVVADASTWADDVRHDQTSPFFNTGRWHFIDIPRGTSSGEVGRFCPPPTGRTGLSPAGCVVTAIEDQLTVLRKIGGERRRAAEALMWLIHLIGDLHQPLHCSTNNDAGGNCVPVTYFGIAPQLSSDHPEEGMYQPNLHAVWDTSIIRRILQHRSAGWFADVLQRRFAAQIPAWQRMPIDLRTWAWESHRVAEQTAYGQLPVAIPLATPQRGVQCSEVSQKMLALHERLGQQYEDPAAPVIEEQLAKAGVRLAMVLNRLWP
jgi:hypothetical protein